MADSWNLRTADGVLSNYNGSNWTFEMYVTKGDTWVILAGEQIVDKLELHQLDLNTARIRWHSRIEHGWGVDRQSRAWRSLMKHGDQ